MLINKDKLKEIIPVIARKQNFRLGIVEKDYYLTVILSNIHSMLSKKLVFKGGTLLNKAYFNYHRLSEDLDFTYSGEEALNSRAKRSKAIAPIREKMKDFLRSLDLNSKKPEGMGFNNSTQYIFHVYYPSIITGNDENINIEVSLRQAPIDKPVYTVIKHFYQDPFTNEDLIPTNKILSLSLNEAVAEKLKAAITRRDKAIRDFYDLWHIAESNFDFYNHKFITLFKKKLETEGYQGDFTVNFGLDTPTIVLLQRQVTTDLMPVIHLDEQFDLTKVFEKFNQIFNNKKFILS